MRTREWCRTHLPDTARLEACIACVWAALRAPGVFVFDLNTPAALAHWNAVHVHESEGNTYINQGIYAPGARQAFLSWRGFLRNPDGSYERFCLHATNTVFPAAEVLELLRKAGFPRCHVADRRDLATPAADPDTLEPAYFVCYKE